MSAVIVNGIDTGLGRRIAAALSDAGSEVLDGRRVVAAEAADLPHVGPLDVVLLAPGHGPDLDGTGLGGIDLAEPTRLLGALDGRDVRRVVVLSSAMVYGAWPTNSVPLSEDAVLRPNPGCGFAADKAELERLVGEWAEGRDVEVAVLRPSLVVSDDERAVTWLERSLWHTPSARQGDVDPPGQFLQVGDLVAAVAHALVAGLDGAFNVAPDGWLRVEEQVDLVGRGGRVRIPGELADPVARTRWRWRLTSTPPEVLPYTMHSWVVANDRLRATGWQPSAANDEAFVEVSRAGWWSSLHGRRRQEVALAALLAGVGGVVALVLVVIRRSART
jgi:nucleoside-diphosphate-sugar epimerase